MKTSNDINWVRMGEYIDGIYDDVESQLREGFSGLDLQKSSALIYTETFPPRIVISFEHSEGCDRRDSANEMGKKEDEVSTIVTSVAGINSLRSVSGALIRVPQGQGRRMVNQVKRAPGNHTLLPNYGEFGR